MDLCTFLIHRDRATLLQADAPGLALLGAGARDELAGAPLADLLPGIDCGRPGAGLSWVRLPSGSRRLLRWTLVANPARGDESLLAVSPAGHPELNGLLYPALLQALNAGHTGPEEVLRKLAVALRECLDLPLACALWLEAGSLHEIGADGAVPEQGVERDTALRAVREERPVLARLAAGDGPRRELHGVLALPLTLAGRGGVIQLFAQDAQDLADPVITDFLHGVTGWLQQSSPWSAAASAGRLAGDALLGAATPAFITDTEGAIVWLNHAFSEVYGHGPDEALGATPRLIKSGVHGPRYYRALWSALRAGSSWSGETVDRGADGRDVTVRQTISPVRQGGRVTHYLSIHADLTEQAQLRRLGERERGFDEISGVLTRAAFEEQARQALCTAHEARTPLAWLLCAVGTRYGTVPNLDAEAQAHVRGILGQRLRQAAGSGAIVGMLEAFDFAVLLRHPDEAAATAQAIADAVAEPLPLLGGSLELRCHIAVARYPEQGTTVAELRLAADRALAREEPGPGVFPAEARHIWTR